MDLKSHYHHDRKGRFGLAGANKDPNNPNGPTYYNDVICHKGYVITANEEQGIRSVKFDDTTGKMEFADYSDLGGRAYSLDQSDDFIFVANYDRGIDVYEIDATGKFTHKSQMDPGTVIDISVTGSVSEGGCIVFAATDNVGVRLYTCAANGTLSQTGTSDQQTGMEYTRVEIV